MEVVPCDANADEFIVRAGECTAAAAGVLRAMTLRLSTPREGVATCVPIFAAPSELARVGVAWKLLVTCAPRNDASVKC